MEDTISEKFIISPEQEEFERNREQLRDSSKVEIELIIAKKLTDPNNVARIVHYLTESTIGIADKSEKESRLWDACEFTGKLSSDTQPFEVAKCNIEILKSFLNIYSVDKEPTILSILNDTKNLIKSSENKHDQAQIFAEMSCIYERLGDSNKADEYSKLSLQFPLEIWENEKNTWLDGWNDENILERVLQIYAKNGRTQEIEQNINILHDRRKLSLLTELIEQKKVDNLVTISSTVKDKDVLKLIVGKLAEQGYIEEVYQLLPKDEENRIDPFFLRDLGFLVNCLKYQGIEKINELLEKDIDNDTSATLHYASALIEIDHVEEAVDYLISRNEINSLFGSLVTDVIFYNGNITPLLESLNVVPQQDQSELINKMMIRLTNDCNGLKNDQLQQILTQMNKFAEKIEDLKIKSEFYLLIASYYKFAEVNNEETYAATLATKRIIDSISEGKDKQRLNLEVAEALVSLNRKDEAKVIIEELQKGINFSKPTNKEEVLFSLRLGRLISLTGEESAGNTFQEDILAHLPNDLHNYSDRMTIAEYLITQADLKLGMKYIKEKDITDSLNWEKVFARLEMLGFKEQQYELLDLQLPHEARDYLFNKALINKRHDDIEKLLINYYSYDREEKLKELLSTLLSEGNKASCSKYINMLPNLISDSEIILLAQSLYKEDSINEFIPQLSALIKDPSLNQVTFEQLYNAGYKDLALEKLVGINDKVQLFHMLLFLAQHGDFESVHPYLDIIEDIHSLDTLINDAAYSKTIGHLENYYQLNKQYELKYQGVYIQHQKMLDFFIAQGIEPDTSFLRDIDIVNNSYCQEFLQLIYPPQERIQRSYKASQFNIDALLNIYGNMLPPKYEEFIKNSGTDIAPLAKDWEIGTGDMWLEHSIANIRLMMKLEEHQKGSVTLLHEKFGISNFARYPEEILKDMIDQIDSNLPFGVIIAAKYDHNGASYQYVDTLRKLHEKIDKRHSIRIIEAEDRFSIVSRLMQVKKDYVDRFSEKISFMIILGHGNKNGVSFGLGNEGNVTFKNIKAATKRILRNKIYAPNMPTAFFSCSVGIPRGPAERQSKLFHGDSVGPSDASYVTSIEPVYNDNQLIKFLMIYSKGNVGHVHYQSGKKVDEVKATNDYKANQ